MPLYMTAIGEQVNVRQQNDPRAKVLIALLAGAGAFLLALGVYSAPLFWPIAVGIGTMGAVLILLMGWLWGIEAKEHQKAARWIDHLTTPAPVVESEAQAEHEPLRTFDLVQGGVRTEVVIDPVADAARRDLLALLDSAIGLAGPDARKFPSVVALENAGIPYRQQVKLLALFGKQVEAREVKGRHTLGSLRAEIDQGLPSSGRVPGTVK